MAWSLLPKRPKLEPLALPSNDGPMPQAQALQLVQNQRSWLTTLNELWRSQTLRTREDLRTLNQAIDAATNPMMPRRHLLIDLYRSAVRDAHLRSVLNTRKLSVLKQPFRLVNSQGQSAPEEVMQAFATPVFDAVLQHVLDSIAWGHSLLEVVFDGQRPVLVVLVPRDHVRPETGEILRQRTDSSGYRYRQQQFLPANAHVQPGTASWELARGHVLLEVGAPHDLGLLESATRAVLLKRVAEVAWTEFAEKFGLPIRILEDVAQTGKDQQEKLGELLRNMGRGGYGVIPMNGGKFRLEDGNKNDAFEVFSMLMKAQDEANSKLILGQTMTTDNGASRAQAQVHKEVAAAYTDADKRFLAGFVNAIYLPLLQRFEAHWAGWRFAWWRYEDMPMKDRAAIYEKLHLMGMMFDPAEVGAEFGVRVVGQREPQAAPPARRGQEEDTDAV